MTFEIQQMFIFATAGDLIEMGRIVFASIRANTKPDEVSESVSQLVGELVDELVSQLVSESGGNVF